MHLESVAPQTLAGVERTPATNAFLQKGDDANENATPKDRMPNFRNVYGFTRLYRGSCPDDIADLLMPPTYSDQNSSYVMVDDISEDSDSFASSPSPLSMMMQPEDSSLSESERFLLNDATLWIDMRFRKEVNQSKLHTLLTQAPGGAFEIIHFKDPRGLAKALSTPKQRQRRIYLGSGNPIMDSDDDEEEIVNQRFYLHHHAQELFSEESFMKYVSDNWVTPKQLENAGDSKMLLLAKTIEDRGLLGMNEAMLEHHEMMSIALQAITIHFEEWQEDQEGRPAKVLVHCTFGKDRTGNLSMLCQHIIGAADEEILWDYFLSQCIRDVALEKVKTYLGGKVDLSSYAECNKEIMRDTLAYLRGKYGSLDGYLDCIGFDHTWRQRFVKVVK
ncbi:tyrosine phosphatase [Nitzschia inconspicua]|uniref:Tyrosine phosphatase n=1 Tax=Nitzschia inconspicua TaxID=303405 RepID=A0A9K3Q2M1_9STRA|nr:tyrosine phosphatase [Nitzschia inconspicua]